jgi:hypothetical protein
VAVTVKGSGSQVATVTTEHTLLDIAVAGVYQLGVDKAVMQALDGLELRIYKIFKTGGTLRVVYKGSWFDAQAADDMGALSPPIMNALTDAASLRFTLKQTLGTSRTFDWEVLAA